MLALKTGKQPFAGLWRNQAKRETTMTFVDFCNYYFYTMIFLVTVVMPVLMLVNAWIETRD